jgi:hypothetical protein
MGERRFTPREHAAARRSTDGWSAGFSPPTLHRHDEPVHRLVGPSEAGFVFVGVGWAIVPATTAAFPRAPRGIAAPAAPET